MHSCDSCAFTFVCVCMKVTFSLPSTTRQATLFLSVVCFPFQPGFLCLPLYVLCSIDPLHQPNGWPTHTHTGHKTRQEEINAPLSLLFRGFICSSQWETPAWFWYTDVRVQIQCVAFVFDVRVCAYAPFDRSPIVLYMRVMCHHNFTFILSSTMIREC